MFRPKTSYLNEIKGYWEGVENEHIFNIYESLCLSDK